MALIPLGNDRYKVRVPYKDVDGVRRHKVKHVAGLTAARKVEILMQADAINGKLGGGNQTFATYVEKWLKERSRNADVAQRTVVGNRTKLQPALKRFGKMRLEDIHRPMVKDWLANLTGSGTTRRHNWTVFRQVMAEAATDRLIPYSPCEGIKPPKTDVKEKRSLTAKQQATLLRLMEQNQQLHVAALVMLRCGLRPSEMLALRRNDVDLKKRELHVLYSMDMDGTLKDTKNHERRTIPLTLDAAAALKRQLASVAELKMQFRELWVDGDFVFPSLDTRRSMKAGRPWRYTPFIRAWNALCRPAGLDFGPHELRHTCGTEWRRSGLRLEAVGYLLGHKPGSVVTAGTYTRHISPEEVAQVRG